METLINIITQQYEDYLILRNQLYMKREARLMDTPLIQVIIGPRRAGKSFFCIHECNHAIYLNFDDEGLIRFPINQAIETAKTIYPKGDILILDEIQNVKDWQLIVNRLHREGYKLIITGSNAHLLSGELTTHLTGRHLPIHILPLSFKEAHSEKNISFTQYLATGGLPENILRPEQTLIYTKPLIQAIVLKDIVQRYNLRKSVEIEALLLTMLSNSAKLYSDKKLTKSTGINSPTTIRKYLSYLEGSFLLFTLQRFTYKTKADMTTLKKGYAYDTAFIKTLSTSKSVDEGRLYETVVAIQLRREEEQQEQKTYFYRNAQGHEADFVIVKDRKVVELIQVTVNPELEREARGLIHASQETNCTHLTILNPYTTEEKTITWFGKSYTICYVRLDEWLLARNC